MTQTPTDPRQELVGRLFDATVQGLEMMTVYLGDRLGLYRALRDRGAATPRELSERAGVAERYAREWLEGQAAAGYLQVDDVAAEAQQRRYHLSGAHAEVLTNRDSLYSGAPLAQLVGVLGSALPRLAEVFPTGEGISWEEYGPPLTEAQGDFNRAWIKGLLGTHYLPAIPDVHQRLTSGQARVADVACGTGWAALAIAGAYPGVTAHGFDSDEYGIQLARQNLADSGLAGRVDFRVQDVTKLAGDGSYDLIICIEAVHDLPRPVEFLSAVREMLAPGGVAIMVDEKAGETFTAPADLLDRLFYAASLLCCLPCGLAEQPSAATGTVIRPETMRRYAADAGFANVTVLDALQHDMLRFYRLDP